LTDCSHRLIRDPLLAIANSPIRQFSNLSIRRSSIRQSANPMNEKALFTKFWIQEAKTTSKVLSRIPESNDYKPDPKSRTAMEIAWQIVGEEKMLMDAIETGKATWSPPPMPKTMKEVVDAYNEQSAKLAAWWPQLPDAKWNGELEFFGNKRPVSGMAWSFLFDIVHHRGQITTYLRPMGSTVPQIYGPSADEPM
jgi:uncharacterized damage-inducible protein DinB